MSKNKLKFEKIPESLLKCLVDVTNENEMVEMGFQPLAYMGDLGFSGFGKYWRSYMWYKEENGLVYTVVTIDNSNTWLWFGETDVFSKRIMGVITGKRIKRPILRDLLYIRWKNFTDKVRNFKPARQK